MRKVTKEQQKERGYIVHSIHCKKFQGTRKERKCTFCTQASSQNVKP